MNNKGFAPVLILVLIGAVLLFLGGYSFIGKTNLLNSKPAASSSPKLTVVYSEKQLNMIAHKEEIKKQLNLTDAQFEAILLMSADTDFPSLPGK